MMRRKRFAGPSGPRGSFPGSQEGIPATGAVWENTAEGVFAWLFQQRRLRVRYEKRDDIHQAFLSIGCIMICWNRLAQFC